MRTIVHRKYNIAPALLCQPSILLGTTLQLLLENCCLVDAEILRQTAGDEELELLVSVDEKDFLDGQKILLKNLELGADARPGIGVSRQIRPRRE